MESQLQHTHGRHYDDAGTLTAGHDHNEDEHQGERKSVIKKVKEKAKKIKSTITKHGHGHDGHDHHHDENDDDDYIDESVEDPEVHGAPMYDSARVGQMGLDASLAQPKGNLERSPVMAGDRNSEPVSSRDSPAPFSAGAYGANLFEPSSLDDSRAYGQGKWRSKMGESTGMEEEPFAPNPTRRCRLVPDPNVNCGENQAVGLRSVIGESTTMVPDPHARSCLGSDPSNYETKVEDPTHTGGKEAELSQLQHSIDKMVIDSESKTWNPNHPKNLPRETFTGNPSSHSSNYANIISSSAATIADKAATAKDVIAAKLGYSNQNPTPKSHEPINHPVSPTDYAHKITDKVAGTLAPVYDKLADAGSSVISKVHGSVPRTEQPQVNRGSEATNVEKQNVTDKGVSVKEHLVETLRPGYEDKALSEMITHAIHRDEDRDKPMGIVTESDEVRRRLGTDHKRGSGDVIADKGVADRLMEAMGSWFGGKGELPQGTSYVTDEGLSSKPTGDGNKGSGSGP
ncbi:hypothetical protein E3N88_12723 [Mikania micrantha]|uniref:Uncharacterized protein n=1 Tax=Mikania micrantha TaxID=192012 RepID=A0A5N6P8D7_9ASTR|nr:hypothetical protein E3N88_12723 [Mikania micrantha]